jgi:sugar phosphate isomerase/epimerase
MGIYAIIRTQDRRDLASPRIFLGKNQSLSGEDTMTHPSRRAFCRNFGLGTAGLAAGAGIAEGKPANPPPRRYSLGLVTYNMAATWNIATILDVCRNVGLSAVELRTTHSHGVEPTLTAQQRQDVRNRFNDAGIQIWGCGTTCEFHSPNQAVVQQNINTCRSFIELVRDIGGRGVKVRPNGMPAGVPVAQTLQQIGNALRTCGMEAAQAGVEIWVEVHGTGTAHPPHMQTIMQQCNHASVGVTWNSNATDIQNGTINNYFQLLRPWIKSVHIHDLYENYPYAELFRLLREMNYDKVTLIEQAGMPDVASAERLLRYYKGWWHELSKP